MPDEAYERHAVVHRYTQMDGMNIVKTELGKLIESSMQSVMLWLQQSDLTHVMSAVMIGGLYITGLYMIGFALTPAANKEPH